MTDVFGTTEEEAAERDRMLAENGEIRDAIRKIKHRQERDAAFLELLKLGLPNHSLVGGFAHDAAVKAARSINGEDSSSGL